MSLREQLEAKARRRVVVPVDLAPASDDQVARLASLQADLLVAIRDNRRDDADRLTEQVESVQAENRAEVAFAALAPVEFEKVVNAFPADDGSGMNQSKALPVLAALCAEDEDLQDDQWWSDQVGGGSWTFGEQQALWQALLHVNSTAPNAYVPKG